jgi:hypothetical protein
MVVQTMLTVLTQIRPTGTLVCGPDTEHTLVTGP